MKKIIIPFALIILLAVSGCTNNGDGEGGAPSISISNFGPLTIGASVDNPVRNDRTIVLTTLIKNEGGAKVTGGKVKIVGLPESWGIQGGESNEKTLDLGIGYEKREIWKYESPETSGYEMDIVYPVEVRYNFGYGTAYRSTFSWISDDKYNEILDTGDEQYINEVLNSKGLTVQESSIGPVSISLEEYEFIGQNPEILLKIENKGNGRLDGEIKNEGVSGLDCGTGLNKIEMLDNKFETYCKVITGTDDDTPVEILVKIKYNYYVSAKSQIYYHDTGKLVSG